ncbi:MAG: tetratricopeptide repeat protein [Rhodospirillaceae bacterium]
MADHSDDALIREIDDEIRQEQFQKAWNRYGKIVIAAAVLIVVGVAGYQIWRNYDLSTRRQLGDQFARAQHQLIAGNGDAATQTFKSLAAGGGGYGLLARFQAARLMADRGDAAGALQAYRAIRVDGGAPDLYKDLADLLAVSLELNAGDADTAALETRLARLAVAGNPWRLTALELQAALALKKGDKTAARAVYEALSKDAGAPTQMKQRAAEMLTILR